MIDSLRTHIRTRIIAVLEANFDDAAPSLSMVDMADAVIRELKLDQPVDFTSVASGIPPFDNGTVYD